MTTEYCISVGVTKEFKNKVATEAKKQNRTISALVKQVLETYLNSLNDTQPDVDLVAQIILLMQQVQAQSETIKTMQTRIDLLQSAIETMGHKIPQSTVTEIPSVIETVQEQYNEWIK